ncbi:serine hydrolase domain-containing protein [Muriicola marianensis]|uniref:Beta-lactamase-related domain-containing protein n=1 Tax=Muriicola marianensis TaxID=1324801 RepID=A0ABQ1R188_9FLAO|nr:serine hydrolase domain-containing protein [Muriicola marianensis]GGD51542.1 hypothetical protein GCM10011361_17830 [Muriicola marianensis]
MRHALFLIALICTSLVPGQDLGKKVGSYVQTYVDTGDFSGCILITKHGNTLYKDCFGQANFSFSIPNTPNTKFKIGSVSKQFTAAAILRLEEEGKLRTDDLVSRFYPAHPHASEITLEQLLTHTSGVTDIYNIPEFNTLSCQNISISEVVRLVLNTDLDFDPGSQYRYSNGGYAVLAGIIEVVSGMSYSEYLKQFLFDPLEMTATAHAAGDEVVSGLATGYEPKGYDGLKITPYISPEVLKGSGSLHSTIGDLQRWVESIETRKLLRNDSYEKFLKNYGHNYGLGISVYTSKDQQVFGHDGRVNGFIADYLHYRESGVTIIILGNVQTGVADFFRSDIASIVFDLEYKSRAKTSPLSEDILDPKPFLGTYAFGPNFKVHIEYFDDSLQARANEGGYSELIPLADGRFFSRTLYSYIDFLKDDEGDVSKMLWINNDGNSFEGVKDN